MHVPTVIKAAALAAASALTLTACSGGASDTTTATPSTPKTTASADAFPRTVKHSSGETTITSKPASIVVLDMAALDTIDALGAGEFVTGTAVASVPTWLKDDKGIDYSKVANVGSLKEPDMEAIAKLKPDLVVVGNRSKSFYEEFSKNFTTIDMTHSWKTDDYSATVPQNVQMLAKAIGADKEGSAAAEAIRAKLTEYKGKGEGKGNALVVMTNAGELSLHNRGSRWAPIWDVFGFGEAHKRDKADEGHKGEKVSFETVKEINPDWMFVVDRDAAIGKSKPGETAQQVLDNELIGATTAAKKGQIVYLTPERWYIVMTGATNFPAMLDEIADAIK